jgi:predicted DNA-binding protein
VSKRVYITLPDKVYEALQQLAVGQGRPVANLAAYLVERAVEQAQSQDKDPEGKIQPKI